MVRRLATILLGFGVLGFGTFEAWAYAPVQSASLRAKLARMYAPEIRQDKQEKYGIGSITWFLQRSLLMMQMRSCGKSFPSLRKGMVWPVLPGSSLMYARYFQVQHPAGCRLNVDPFSIRKQKRQGELFLAAPNLVFLQLRNHTPQTLLTGRYRRWIVPEINYRVYQAMGQRCLKRSWLGSCKEYKFQRFYVIQYFVHLMLNNACNVHEGEMEGMTVLIDRGRFDYAKSPADYRKAVVRVGFAGHYEVKILPASKVKFVKGTHPVAYMGDGGHALYPTPGVSHRLKQYAYELRRVMKRTCARRKRLWGLVEKHRGGGDVYQSWKPVTPLKQAWTPRSGCRWNPWLGKAECQPASRPHRLLQRNDPRNRLLPFQTKTVAKAKTQPTTLTKKRAAKELVKKAATRKSKKIRHDPVRRSTLLNSKKPLNLTAAQVSQAFRRELGVKELSTLRRIKAFQPGCVLRLKRTGVRLCDVQKNAKDSPCCMSETLNGFRRWVLFAGRWGKQESFAASLAGKTAAGIGRYLKRWPLGQSMGNSGPFGPRFIFETTWRWHNPLYKPKATPPHWR